VQGLADFGPVDVAFEQVGPLVALPLEILEVDADDARIGPVDRCASPLLELPTLSLHEALQISVINVEVCTYVGDLGAVLLELFLSDYLAIPDLGFGNNKRVGYRLAIQYLFLPDQQLEMLNGKYLIHELQFFDRGFGE
jgi:hypothetical protein